MDNDDGTLSDTVTLVGPAEHMATHAAVPGMRAKICVDCFCSHA